MKVIIVALLLSVLTLISAQTLKCSFSMHAGYLKNGGALTGQVTYDWAGGNGGNIRWDYNAPGGGQTYYEIHQYNSDLNGYDAQSSIRYKDQWNYQVGAGCGCETGSLDNSMPIMAPRAPPSAEATYLSQGFTAGQQTINGIQCNTFTLPAANDDTYGGVTTFVDFYAFSSTDGTIVQMGYSDGRTFTFSGCSANPAIDQSLFNTPPDCKCGRPIDIVIVLDRSGSIDALEWRDQRAFVINFTASFDYGPLGANLAITNFNHDFWTTLTLAEGSTQQNVQTVVNAMACSGHPSCNAAANDWQTNPTMSCCCCGTSISGGMHNGALLLQTSTRQGVAQPILLTVTDGYHNTQLNGAACGDFVPGGCSGDLADTVAFCENTIPGIIMYAVGVGADRSFSTEELLICCQNVPSRLLTVTSFSELAAATLELVARTCNENAQPCGGCCGLCVCGACQAVNTCDQPADKCITSAIPPGQTCCTTTTVQCQPNNPCMTYSCDSNTGTCNGTATALPPSTQCTTYKCDPINGITSVALDCAVKVDDCTTATDVRCDDKNACTVDSCDLMADPKKCEYTVRNCSSEAAYAPDMCSTVDCDIVKGCVRTEFPASYCDDGSNCTVDYCDPKIGCVNQLVNCADNDSCTVDTCNKVFGCLHTPVICNASVAQLPPEDANLSPGCILGFCVQQNDSNAQPLCATRSLDCPAGVATATIVGATLGTAAIIGLVIAAVVVALAVAGGGAYAYSQNAGGGGLAVVGNNPIYAGNTNAGMNPLYNVGK